jgi:hypothetical protein
MQHANRIKLSEGAPANDAWLATSDDTSQSQAIMQRQRSHTEHRCLVQAPQRTKRCSNHRWCSMREPATTENLLPPAGLRGGAAAPYDGMMTSTSLPLFSGRAATTAAAATAAPDEMPASRPSCVASWRALAIASSELTCAPDRQRLS